MYFKGCLVFDIVWFFVALHGGSRAAHPLKAGAKSKFLEDEKARSELEILEIVNELLLQGMDIRYINYEIW